MIAIKILLCLVLSAQLGSCTDYDPDLALRMSYYSSIAYEDKSVIATWKCPNCTKLNVNQKVVQKSLTYGIQILTAYDKDKKQIVVAFEGSTASKQYLLLLETDLVAYDDSSCLGGCKISSGVQKAFKDALKTAAGSLSMMLRIYTKTPVMVTGHGVGGALAIMFGLAMKTGKVDQVSKETQLLGVYTFGSPRIGNDKFALHCQSTIKNIYRVVNKAGPFTHFPSQVDGYKHTNFEVWYKANSKFVVCLAEDAGCSNSVKSYSWADHQLWTYQLALANGKKQTATPIQKFIVMKQDQKKAEKTTVQAAIGVFATSLIKQGKISLKDAPANPKGLLKDIVAKLKAPAKAAPAPGKAPAPAPKKL